MNAILTVAEAAERMNVSRQRMHKLIESYHLNTQKIQGRLLVMDEDELKKIPKERKNISATKSSVAKMDRMSTTTQEMPISQIDLSALIIEAIEKGETATSIAKRANVALTMVSRLRNRLYDSSPSLEHVQSLLAALGYEIYVRPMP